MALYNPDHLKTEKVVCLTRFRDYGFVGVLALYILAGCWLVPLHGDEPTVIYTSWDVDAIRRGDLSALQFRDPPVSASDPQFAARQDLRLLNGVVNRYGYGALWTLAGMPVSSLNDQWLWGADLAFNRANGHVPSDGLLFLCRFASGLLTALSVALVFVIGKRAGGARTAYLAATLYTLTPSLLLNGRRAMMESGFLLCAALVAYVGQKFAPAMLKIETGSDKVPYQEQSAKAGNTARIAPDIAPPSRPIEYNWLPSPSTARRDRRSYQDKPSLYAILLGLVAGLCVASKHTGLLTVAAVMAGVGLWVLLRGGVRRMIQSGLYGVVALGIGVAVFIALNPVWWTDPVGVGGRVLARRQALLEGQTAAFGGYANFSERVSGLIREGISAPPQFYEVQQGWPEWIGREIARYQGSPWPGITHPVYSGLIGALMIVGIGRGVRRWRDPAAFVILSYSVLTLAAVFVLTPVPWQRYYLPLVAPVALCAGLAGMERRTR